MATKYTMQEVLDLNNEGKTLLYPRIINRGNIKLDRLAEMIASNSTIPRTALTAGRQPPRTDRRQRHKA